MAQQLRAAQEVLGELYANQREAASAAVAQAELPAGAKLGELAKIARLAMRAVAPGFAAEPEQSGSWIANQVLPTQLLLQPRLTVDLTPEELEVPRPFGLPFEGLIELARAGHLYFNLRNFDSDERTGFVEHGRHDVFARLRQLLEVRPNCVYIGSALRQSVFDVALRAVGRDESYASFQQEAFAALKPAYDCYAQLAARGGALRGDFRGRRTTLDAVSWHWAFLNAARGLLPEENFGGEDAVMVSLYRRAVELATFPDHERQAAHAFDELAQHLRACHLAFTAPITAAWGTTYNMSSAEYAESLQLTPSKDAQTRVVRDEDIQAFVHYLFSRTPAHQCMRLAAADPVERSAATDQIFSTQELSSLIRVLDDKRHQLRAANKALASAWEIYAAEGRLADAQGLIRDYQRAGDDIVHAAKFKSGCKRVFAALAGLTATVGMAGKTCGTFEVVAPWLLAVAAASSSDVAGVLQAGDRSSAILRESVCSLSARCRLMHRVHGIVRSAQA